jgi:hypothetical protein
MSDPSDFDPIWLVCVTENAKERYMVQLYPSDSLNTFIARIQAMRPSESFVSETTRRTCDYQLTYERDGHEQAIDWEFASKPIKELGLEDGTVLTLKPGSDTAGQRPAGSHQSRAPRSPS